jgi:gamma-glutamylcyclotransferase (GGCT)/AIG2-like uncharacterized protein YtfP
MTYSNEPEIYAVYGTLRRGFGNHRIINKEPLKTETLAGYAMFTNGGFPMIIPAKKTNKITIELYEISDVETKIRLDNLEGYHQGSDSGMYLRRKVFTSKGESWIYIWNRGVDRLELIKSGDFKKYYRERTN